MSIPGDTRLTRLGVSWACVSCQAGALFTASVPSLFFVVIPELDFCLTAMSPPPSPQYFRALPTFAGSAYNC